MDALSHAIELAGGQTALADKLTLYLGRPVSQGRIGNWLRRDRKVPAEMGIPIEKVVNGEVTRHELCPEIYPADESARPDHEARMAQ